MSKVIVLTGQRFGRLTVISRAENDKVGQALWHCFCDCGNEIIVFGWNLRTGNTKSCGCLRKEVMAENIKKTFAAKTNHGLSWTRLYRIWGNMKERTTNPKLRSYKNYGGRGITVCPEWTDKENGFINFYKWAMSHGYSDELSIDRIDNDKGYSPDNCRWANAQQQTDNRRCSKPFVWEGITYKSMSECARQLGIPIGRLYRRAKKQKEREEE